jgi:hypothetical protein
VRPVLIVVGLVPAQDPPQAGCVPYEGAVEEFAAASADPPFGDRVVFMRGVWMLQSMVRILVSARTSDIRGAQPEHQNDTQDHYPVPEAATNWCSNSRP